MGTEEEVQVCFSTIVIMSIIQILVQILGIIQGKKQSKNMNTMEYKANVSSQLLITDKMVQLLK